MGAVGSREFIPTRARAGMKSPPTDRNDVAETASVEANARHTKIWQKPGAGRALWGRGSRLGYAPTVTDSPPSGPKVGSPGAAPSIVALVAQGVLDSELAALVWLLVEARVPLVVAAPEGRAGAGGQLLAGIIGSIHADEQTEALLAPMGAAGASSLVRGRRAGGVLEAASLAEVRTRLGSGPLPLSEDQLTFLGCVLVIGEGSGGRRGRLRVTAAHYVRPLARDAHGHSQRLDPAVLAAWDSRLERYEHFAWGVLPEIAARLGRRTGDLEADLHHRRDDLAGLAKAGLSDIGEVRRLIAGYRVRWGDADHSLVGEGGHAKPGAGHGLPGNAHDGHAHGEEAGDGPAKSGGGHGIPGGTHEGHAHGDEAGDGHAHEGGADDGNGHRPH